MLEEILVLLRESETVLKDSPVADQAAQDVRDVEAIAAKHAEAAAKDVQDWLIKRLHPLFGSHAEAQPVS